LFDLGLCRDELEIVLKESQVFFKTSFSSKVRFYDDIIFVYSQIFKQIIRFFFQFFPFLLNNIIIYYELKRFEIFYIQLV
jgi:hypothetical protein